MTTNSYTTALWRLTQEDSHEYEAGLGYLVSSKTTRPNKDRLRLKKNGKNKIR